MLELEPLPREQLFPEETPLGQLIMLQPDFWRVPVRTDKGEVTITCSEGEVSVLTGGRNGRFVSENIGSKKYRAAHLARMCNELGITGSVKSVISQWERPQDGALLGSDPVQIKS